MLSWRGDYPLSAVFVILKHMTRVYMCVRAGDGGLLWGTTTKKCGVLYGTIDVAVTCRIAMCHFLF